MNSKQKTLAKEITLEGVGLHSGEVAKIIVQPATLENGITFEINDVKTKITPGYSNTQGHCNAFKTDGGIVMTVEHLLSALWGMGIDNANIVVEGKEIPGLDGSAIEFVKKINEAGVLEQEQERKVFIPKNPISVGDAKAGITAYPDKSGKFTVTYILDYPETKIAQGRLEIEVNEKKYVEEIAPARTFVPLKHVEMMQKAGLGKGANVKNTLVLDNEKVVDNELRFKDECVRHKILDLVGDLAFTGVRIGVHIVANKSGHTLNLELAKKIALEVNKYENPQGIMDIKAIEAMLPHRYPFLLVDRVIELEPKKRIVAVKNVTRNEEFFQGHFPGQPIMPGVLQIEALAQAGAIMMLGNIAGQNKLAVLMSVDNVKFRRQVVPGDQILLHAEFEKLKTKIGIAKAWSTVDGEPVVDCVIKFAIVDAYQP